MLVLFVYFMCVFFLFGGGGGRRGGGVGCLVPSGFEAWSLGLWASRALGQGLMVPRFWAYGCGFLLALLRSGFTAQHDAVFWVYAR